MIRELFPSVQGHREAVFYFPGDTTMPPRRRASSPARSPSFSRKASDPVDSLPAVTPSSRHSRWHIVVPQAVKVIETVGESETIFTTSAGEDGHSTSASVNVKRPEGELQTSLRRFASDCFLPDGYPASVTPDYLPYQFWDTAQGVCSYLSGVLCQRAMLKGMGVGNAEATASAGAHTGRGGSLAGRPALLKC